MYNHIRNLLVNLTGNDSYYDNVPGDELIPSEYFEIENLPTFLQVARSRIFGAKPDRAMLNYRAAQLLEMISCTELQEYVTATDPRITYEKSGRSLKSGFEPEVVKIGGSATDILTLKNTPIRPDITGRSGYEYHIAIEASPTDTVTVTRRSWPASTETSDLTITSGLSQEIALTGSGFKVYVNAATDGAAWIVKGFIRPSTNLSAIEESLREIGEPYLLQIFGVKDVEPYLTFKNCWNNHPDLAYRLGGITLAMAYRMGELTNA